MAIHDSPLIKLSTRERVKAAAIEHNYRPNQLARAMKLGKSKVIAILVPTLRLSFYAQAVDVMEQVARENGYFCFVAQTHSSAQILEAEVSLFRERCVDGLIIYPVNQSEQIDLYRQLLEDNVVFVTCDHALTGVRCSSVVSHNKEIGRLATEHLIKMGHRRIACITGHLGTSTAQGRLCGYKEALKAAGIKLDENMIFEGTYEESDGEQAVQKWKRDGVAFTGIVASEDAVAITAMFAILDQGRKVPEDISIVGTGDFEISRLVPPRLTTVDQQVDHFAKAAIEQLLAHMHGAKRIRSVVIPPRLLARGSTAAAPVIGGSVPCGHTASLLGLT